MQIKNYAFSNLPFSDLFKAYVTDFDSLSQFYDSSPFSSDAIKNKGNSFSFKGNRKKTAEILKEFNAQFDVEPAAMQNIERLESDDALTIVTGQQLGLYGGLTFTMFKTISTIHLAKQLEKKLARPVIPVFWLADEDHDYDEIRSVSVLNGEGLASFSLPKKENALPPVSELELPPELEELEKKIQSTLIDTDFSSELWELLNTCFEPGKTFLDGFGSFISRLFSKHGLVLAGSNHLAVKEETKSVLKTAVSNADEVRKALDKQTIKLGEQFHQQVTLYDSHLFFLDSEKGRTKISRKEKQWITGNGRRWSTQELLKEIEKQPQSFSPDVFLRPVLQDRLLPALGYVAGPGEIAYYGQMKMFYRCFGQEMPIIFPRLSGTFVEPAIVRIFNELPFEVKEYNNRIEDLESSFVDRTEQLDIDTIFKKWKKEADKMAASFKEEITHVDESLEGAAEKVQAHYVNELDKLKAKVYRAVKKREKTQLDRIRRIQNHLFPDRNLQERTLSGIYYMNKFGLDIWDRLLDEMEEKESIDSHALIYL